MMKRFLASWTCIVLLAVPLWAQVSSSETVIYLVRHGETPPGPYDSDPPNPDLTEAGQRRAQELVRVLRDVPVSRIFSTNLKRTLQTARPLAEAKGLQIETYDPANADAFVHELRSTPGVYVVSGHSNTTPDMVTRLGGRAGIPIEHWEFDRLYILVYRMGSHDPTTVLLRYGEASQAP